MTHFKMIMPVVVLITTVFSTPIEEPIGVGATSEGTNALIEVTVANESSL